MDTKFIKKFIATTILCAAAVFQAGAQTGVVSSHAVDANDATTYIIKGHGNINDIMGEGETYAFSYDGSLVIYKSNEGDGTKVTQNEVYSPSTTYYVRNNVYTQATEEPTHGDVWTIKNTLYQVNGSKYTKISNGHTLEDGSYATMNNEGETIADISTLLEDMEASDYVFGSNCSNIIYTWNASNEWNQYFEAVKSGASYDSNQKYYIFADGNSNGKNPYGPTIKDGVTLYKYENEEYSNIAVGDIEVGGTYYKNDWNGKIPGTEGYQQTPAKKNYDYTEPNGSAYATSEEIKDYLLTQKFKEGVYSVQQNYIYTNVSGAPYDSNAGLTYKSGVSFTTLTDEQVKSVTYTTHTVNVTTNGSEYYVLDGAEYKLVKNKDIYKEPVEGQTQYYIVSAHTFNPVTLDYLKSTTGVNNNTLVYLSAGKEFWVAIKEEINAINDPKVKTVKFVSDNDEDIFVGQNVTMAMTGTTVNVLDMSATKIEEIVSPFTDLGCSNKNPLVTFGIKGDLYKWNQTIETLYTPQVTGTGVLYQETFSNFHNLHNLHISEGVTELGQKSIERTYDAWLSTITFPNTLTTVRTGAVTGHFNAGNKNIGGGYTDLAGVAHRCIETLTFPSGMQLIETGAFSGTCPKDVYFLGVEAPVVQKYAWGDNAYISNNALTPAAATIGTEGATVTVNLDYGRACRDNYTAQSGWLAMLHYPSTCTKAQAAKYTDVTRDYRRINYNTYGWQEGDGVKTDPDDPTMTYGSYGTSYYTWYTPGKETTPLTGSGATVNAAVKSFGNEYPWPSTQFTAEEYPEGYFGGDYSGGYYDYTVGGQYLWPSMGMAYRATVVAQNDVLWDGVTTIGEGIRNAGDASFEGDGTEYIGLHQFVFAAADANGGSTTDWDLEKYADGIWHTICLPFNMTKKQMKETFGAAGRDAETNEQYYKIKLCKFNKVERNNDVLALYFTDEQFAKEGVVDDDIVLQAHVSYMIKAEKDKVIQDKSVFHGFQMEAGNPIPTQIADTGERTSHGNYRFVGNYTQYSNSTSATSAGERIKIPQYSYFYSKTYHRFRFQTGNTGLWNPYSAVVYTPDGAGNDDYQYYFQGISTTMLMQAKVSTLFAEDNDDPTQTIAIVVDDNEIVYTNSSVYNLNGVKVGNSIEGLPAGIYIVNGKKYFVR